VSPGGGAPRRVRVRVTGTVQGVGFRPFVYRLADELRLGGWVLNDTEGVLAEVEGDPAAVERFLAGLRSEAPPLAAVEGVAPTELDPTGETGFAITESESGGEAAAPVTPEAATCDDCLAELRDPGDRRHRYPFINCTNCGPRFTIVRGVPYDRPLTTMAGFEMCELCRAEYEDPLDRRFHAQPNACPRCGPRATLLRGDGDPASNDGAADAVAAAAAALREGAIVAVKGLGGYHLACRADHEAAVATLRARKHREDKPFALMVAGVAAAREMADLGAEEEAALRGRRAPIVLAPRREGAAVAAAVAPAARELGLMAPYSPLHHLLLGDAGTSLVMTSGNVSDEPIAFRDSEALRRLGGIADLFLTHDRPIETRTDDSVLRVVAAAGERRPLMLRRSRGYVPDSIELPLECPQHTLACGAELKSTFCVGKGRRAWVSHHIGDLENLETLTSFREGIEHFTELFAVAPRVCAHDLHPDYLSTRYALEREGVELVGVQHHHAHLAACLAEHGEAGPALGAIYDGTGYGNDGTVWGGELLLGGLAGFERAGHLRPLPMPGGAAAIREPWRMACSWLAEVADPDEPGLPAALAGAVEPRDWRNCLRVRADARAAPLTSSMGRLFDAVAALCGAPARVNYEGQAAIELEAMADPAERDAYELALVDREGGATILDPVPAVAELAAELEAGVAPGLVSARFHNGVAAATAAACAAIAAPAGVETAVLSGGVFQNRPLLERCAGLLAERGLRVLVPHRLPPNDGGISYGQMAVAAASFADQ
jgi:hydrogenase maturation protein HypF